MSLASDFGIFERDGLRVFLDEEVERVVDRHFGEHVDRDRKFVGRLREHQPRQIIAVRILLPVDEMVLGLDLQRIGQDRRAAMRGRPQADDLRPERHRAVIGIAGGVVEFRENGHCGECLSWRRVVPFMGIGTRACHVRIAGFSSQRRATCRKMRRLGEGPHGKVGGTFSDARGMTSTATSTSWPPDERMTPSIGEMSE